VDEAQYQAGLVMAHAIAATIRELPLAELLREVEHAEAMGPFLDPTAWMRKGKQFREDAAVLRALHGAQRSLERLHAEARNGAPS
jgi:hypothetical protein